MTACSCGMWIANRNAPASAHGDSCPVRIAAREKERQMKNDPLMNTIFTPDQQGPAVTDAEVEQLRAARLVINDAITKSRRGAKVEIYQKQVRDVMSNETTRSILFDEIIRSGWHPGVIEGQRDEVNGLALVPHH